MKCLVIDDDPLVCDLLDFYCNKVNDITSVMKAESGFEVVNLLNETSFDILFLDFNLPDLTAKEILPLVPKSTAVVMVTSNQDFALDSYSFEQIVDFLLKPVDFSHFMRGFQKAKTFLSAHGVSNKNLFVKDGNKLVKILLHEVKFFKSEGNYISIVLEDKKVLTLMALKDVERSLPDNFMRVHRSYIVNLDFIRSIDNNLIEIHNNQIPVSQSYENDLLKKITFLN